MATAVVGLALTVLTTAYSVYDSETKKRQAANAAKDLEEQKKRELAMAQKNASDRAKEHRLRSSLYGRQSTFGGQPALGGEDQALGGMK